MLLRLFPLLATFGVISALAADTWQWSFDDPAGLPLPQIEGPAQWTEQLDQTVTTGRGALRIRRGLRSIPNSYVPLPAEWRDQPLWLTLRISGWNLSGRTGETLRLGFSATAHESNPAVLAQVRITREREVVQLFGESPRGDAPLGPHPLAPATSNRPVTIVLYVNPSLRRYAVLYRVDGQRTLLGGRNSGDWRTLGEGTLTDSRKARYLRFGVVGPFNSNRSEFFDLDELIVGTAKPAELP